MNLNASNSEKKLSSVAAEEVIECLHGQVKKLESDLAGAHPWYLYISEDKKTALYSKNITNLLDSNRIRKPLLVREEGVSFLLQSGVVPPPETIYKNVYVIGIGITATIYTNGDRFQVEFSHSFPFGNQERRPYGTAEPDEYEILELLAKATRDEIDPSRASYLFHSAGKDSNTLALALAEAGWQSEITFITQESKGEGDESGISRGLARRLGFRHEILKPSSDIEPWPKNHIYEYFQNAPFPCTDNVTIAYPLYILQQDKLVGSNIIDGMGNDVFIGHIPPPSEFRKQEYARYLRHLQPIGKFVSSTSLIHAAARFRPEHTGLGGLSEKDARELYPAFRNVRGYWASLDDGSDYLDLRARIRGGVIDQEVFIRKIRNFCDAYGATLALPWAAEPVARYFSKLPEEWLFDRDALKNKLFLRKMLKDKIGLDSDAIGKYGFGFDRDAVVQKRRPWVREMIVNCSLWDRGGVEKVVDRFYRISQGKGRASQKASALLNRLLLISLWYSNNRYIR